MPGKDANDAGEHSDMSAMLGSLFLEFELPLLFCFSIFRILPQDSDAVANVDNFFVLQLQTLIGGRWTAF